MNTIRPGLKVVFLILTLSFLISSGGWAGPGSQSSTKKSSAGNKNKTAQNKKTTTGSKNTASTQSSQNKQTQKGNPKSKDAPKPGALPADQIGPLKDQASQMIKFFESTLNFLADKKNSVQDKQVIISESYLKFFWDSEVQIEDDLDEHIVPFPKDVQAYLADVDFFFKRARFTYNVQDISVMTNDLGNTFFKVTSMRNLAGMTLNGDSVNNNKVRYIEINFDEGKQQLKIVSVYTTKINEHADMRTWWNGLSQGWQVLLGGSLKLSGGQSLSAISNYNDTVAMIAGQKATVDQDEFYRSLDQIMGTKKLDLSASVTISDLSPLSRLSGLQELNISGTPVSDLMPLRNLNNLVTLNLSGTSVSSLEPLHYCTHIKSLNLKGTQVSDLSLLSNFPELEDLDISQTPVVSLEPIKDLTNIDDLRMAGTRVSDLGPIAGLVQIGILNITSTPVKSLEPLKNLQKLSILMADSSGISSLKPLDGLPALQRIYCDNTKLPKTEAIAFMIAHLQVFLVFESAELDKWWKGMGPDWQGLLSHFTQLGNPPTKEQLHKLILVDSLNITGRMNIKSLDPASMLSLLRVLYASSTGVSSVDPLKNLSNLQILFLNNTQVGSLQSLSLLTKMQTLSVENTAVADLSPLYGMSALKLVMADNSQVNDKTAGTFMDKNPGCLLIYQTFENNNWWKGLTKAWQDVFSSAVSCKGTPDKFQLQQIAGLQKLVITENFSISDLSPLTNLTRLNDLTFTGTSVSNLEPLRSLSSLVSMNCGKNPVTDLSPLAGLSSLKNLDFSNSQVEELMPIQNMTQLETLKFNGTPVKRLKYLVNLRNLKVLELYNTKVSSLDELEQMRNLESLKIFNTKISAKRVEKFKQTHPKCEVVFY